MIVKQFVLFTHESKRVWAASVIKAAHEIPDFFRYKNRKFYMVLTPRPMNRWLRTRWIGNIPRVSLGLRRYRRSFR